MINIWPCIWTCISNWQQKHDDLCLKIWCFLNFLYFQNLALYTPCVCNLFYDKQAQFPFRNCPKSQLKGLHSVVVKVVTISRSSHFRLKRDFLPALFIAACMDIEEIIALKSKVILQLICGTIGSNCIKDQNTFSVVNNNSRAVVNNEVRK